MNAVAVAWQCPLCPLTGLARADDPAAVAVAAADALEDHITNHHRGEDQ